MTKTTFVYHCEVTSRPELTFKVVAGSVSQAADTARAYVRGLYATWGGFKEPPDFRIVNRDTAAFIDAAHLE